MSATRTRYTLPERYFLASNRFITKKNLPGLLHGFAGYRKVAGLDPWDLVLLGDGPLRSEVERLIEELGLCGAVHLRGFKQYADLPTYYGLAQAFVHASTSEQWGLVVNEAMAAGLPVLVSDRCGCAPDLVADGRNGFTFPPRDHSQLAGLMVQLAAEPDRRIEMGLASQAHIRLWGPERFADGFWAAAGAALAAPRRRPRLLSRCMLRLL
jgi:glycosyltransferase involved in cell wall biosynthesis